MNEISLISSDSSGINDQELMSALISSLNLDSVKYNKILLVPPDLTRMHSGAGKITALYYGILKDISHVDIMPALGTHDPMTAEECRIFFGDCVPYSCIIHHNWRTDIVKLGEVPGEFVSSVSENLISDPIDVEVNSRLMDRSYDLILSIGQVVPHEVVGMANYSKNIFVGCGGSSMINSSHMLGAFYGMERIMGRDHSPVRKVFDYAEEKYLKDLPLKYVLTVTTHTEGKVNIHGLYAGRDRKLFEQAVLLSQEKNLTFVQKALKKVVVYLDESEFKSTWLGNKSIYRTRMAIADGGELIVLAPGVKKFGEDEGIDKLIRKYGYVGRKKVLELCEEKEDLRKNLSVAAHLIHGSSDERFSITYAVDKLSRDEIEGVNFKYMSLQSAIDMYNPATLSDGFNTMPNGEEIFYISNPALGLWASRSKFV